MTFKVKLYIMKNLRLFNGIMPEKKEISKKNYNFKNKSELP